MKEQQVSIAINRLLCNNLTVSFYGESKIYGCKDLHDYVVFHNDLGDELGEMNTRHMTENDAVIIKYELNKFWDKAAEMFIKSDQDIKRFFEGFCCER